MSFWSRLTSIVDNTWDGVYASATGAVGVIWDLAGELAEAPGQDLTKFEGDEESVADVLERRLPQIANGLIGPESGLGTTIGGLPESFRGGFSDVIDPVLGGLETTYREVIGEPIATALTVGSLAESARYGEQGGSRNPFNRRIWRDAYRISQDRSPGQAFALTFTKDILDEREVERARGSDWFRVTSGASDAVLRMSNLSPDQFLANTVTGARLSRVTQPITTTGVVTARGAEVSRRSLPVIGVQRPFMPQVYRVPVVSPDAAAMSPRVKRLVASMEGKTAAEIADTHFARSPFRAEIASLLAEAPDAAARTEVMKGLMGSGRAIDALGKDSAHLANRIRRVQGNHEALVGLGESGFVVPGMRLKDEAERLSAELDELYEAQRLLERREAAYGSLQQVPRYRTTVAARQAVVRSDVFQTSRYAAPLRVVYHLGQKLPQRLINLEDPTSDVQIERLVRKAGLPNEQADALRGAYMAATTADARQIALIRAEEAAVQAIAARYGIEAEAVGKILDASRDGRGRAISALRSRVYDGEGRSRLELREGSEPVDIPLFVSQQANVLPLVDIDAVERAARDVGRRWTRYKDTGVRVTDDVLSKFYELWKPAVLLRPAWPIRVAIDEQMRLMAKLGFLATFNNTTTAMSRAVHNSVRRHRGEAKALPGRGPVVLDGYEFQGAFGAPGEAANIFQHNVSSRASFEQFAGRYEKGFLEKFRRKAIGEWRSIDPDEVSYAQAWENAVNRQIGSDPVGRQLLEGRTDEEIVTWLRSTAEGQKYARRLPTRARTPERWLPAAREQVESYLPAQALRDAALAGTAKADDLAKWVPNAAERPLVHGEILAQILGGSPVNETYEKVIRTLYDALGRAPTDALARQPYADAIYRAEVERQFRLYDKQGVEITDKVMRRIEGQARRQMVVETRRLLYDLAEQSEISQVMRFAAPFFSAWQEVLTVWAGVAVENPAYIARVLKAYAAPDKAGLVTTDDQGEKYVAMKLPEWAQDKIPGFASVGAVRFNMGSLNMVLSGPPGAGPVVQIPVAYLLRDRPDLAENDLIQTFIFPFGVPDSVMQGLIPPTLKRLISAAREEDDEAYLRAKLRIWQTKIIEVSEGKRPPATVEELEDEAAKEARSFFTLRGFVSFVSPVGLSFDSPYQPYIEAYRRMREEDPQTADERFLDTYGPEFFPLTQALTRTVDGIPATVEGYKAAGRYGELIDGLEEPDLARLIVGAEGAGEFARSVYEHQLDQGAATDGRQGRVALSKREFIEGPNVRLGWIEYRRAMDTINAELLARGLPNMQVRAARDLRAAKKAVVQDLAQRFPEWHAQFSITDRSHWSKRMRDLRKIAADPKMQARPDVRGLNEYLALREVIVGELRQRKAHTLQAGSNASIRRVWDAAVDQIVANNPAFGALADRWLSNDPVWLSEDAGVEEVA